MILAGFDSRSLLHALDSEPFPLDTARAQARERVVADARGQGYEGEAISDTAPPTAIIAHARRGWYRVSGELVDPKWLNALSIRPPSDGSCTS